MKKSVTKTQKVVLRRAGYMGSGSQAKLAQVKVSLPVQDDTLHDPTVKAGHLSPRVPSSVRTQQQDDPGAGMKAQYDRSHRHEK